MVTDAPREDSLAVPRLGKVLLLSSSHERRAWAARTLGELGHTAAYAYLRRALWDPHEDVRATVVDAIAALAVSQSAGELAAVYAWSGSRLRRGVVRAVGRIGGGSQFDCLLRLAAEDPDRRVRALALRSARAGAMARRRS